MKLATALLRARAALYTILALLLATSLVLSAILLDKCYLAPRSPPLWAELGALLGAFASGFGAVYALQSHLPSQAGLKSLGFATHLVAAFGVDSTSYLFAIALWGAYRPRALGRGVWTESLPRALAASQPVHLAETDAISKPPRVAPGLVRVVGYAFALATALATLTLAAVRAAWGGALPSLLVGGWAALSAGAILALALRPRTSLRTETAVLADLALTGLCAMGYLSACPPPEGCTPASVHTAALVLGWLCADVLGLLLGLAGLVLLRARREGVRAGTFGDMVEGKGLAWVFAPGEAGRVLGGALVAEPEALASSAP
ncbi:hypothetical protein Q8F55_001520 [Vanrija albida]|uniref:MARVEL domain-containing protein n=1 Tax=Vanrija albida TaxID=181172 RepID=A0ABR3QG86_9TREE